MWFWCVWTLVLVLDQASKAWVVASFRLYESRPVIPGLFNLTYLTNTGGAFGLFAGPPSLGRQMFFLAVGLAAMIGIWFVQRRLGASHRLYVFSLALISGGAAGNLVDRFRQGSVIDFFDFYLGSHHWPAFNIADSAITIGVALFLLLQWRQNRDGAEPSKDTI